MTTSALSVLVTGLATVLAARHGDVHLRRARRWSAAARSASPAALVPDEAGVEGVPGSGP